MERSQSQLLSRMLRPKTCRAKPDVWALAPALVRALEPAIAIARPGRLVRKVAAFSSVAAWLTGLIASADHVTANAVHSRYWNDGAPLASWTVFLLGGWTTGGMRDGSWRALPFYRHRLWHSPEGELRATLEALIQECLVAETAGAG